MAAFPILFELEVKSARLQRHCLDINSRVVLNLGNLAMTCDL